MVLRNNVMSYLKDVILLMAAFGCIYLGSLPLDQKCDLTVAAIDYTLDGASNLNDMLDGKMSLISYIRQNVARHLKDFYDNSECT